MSHPNVLIDDPRPLVRRLTLNRPDKRNALSNALRVELFDALRAADVDEDVHVVVIRGAGPCFSAGYDLTEGPGSYPYPRPVANRDGAWARHLVDGWFEMWDLATPVIAQVHGFCLAGGTELATACDLVYIAEDATVGYPPVRMISPPDLCWQPWVMGYRRGMEAMLTGDAMTGTDAVTAGFANRAYRADELEAATLAMAERVAKIPPDLQALNKRAVHRSLEAMGVRAAARATTELTALAGHQAAARAYGQQLAQGVTAALDTRDAPFGDYRTASRLPS